MRYLYSQKKCYDKSRTFLRISNNDNLSQGICYLANSLSRLPETKLTGIAQGFPPGLQGSFASLEKHQKNRWITW